MILFVFRDSILYWQGPKPLHQRVVQSTFGNLGIGQSSRHGFELRKILSHLRAIQRLVDTLVTSCTIDFRHISCFTKSIMRKGARQRFKVLKVQITNHSDTIPSRCTLGRIALPARERTGVVAIGTVDAKRAGHVGHQTISPFGLFDGVSISTG